MNRERSSNGRQCGECTACCTVLAVTELGKPMRWACDHLGCAGCRVYGERPQSCRAFDCLWLRGGVGPDESFRPDRLGVIFDSFTSPRTNEARYVAFEVWNGAFEGPAASATIEETARGREVQLSYRDGTWRMIGGGRAAGSAAPHR
jgi:hypothetical protein